MHCPPYGNIAKENPALTRFSGRKWPGRRASTGFCVFIEAETNHVPAWRVMRTRSNRGAPMSHAATVAAIYQAFGQGDMNTPLSHLDENVDWEYTSDNDDIPMYRRRKGLATAGRVFATLADVEFQSSCLRRFSMRPAAWSGRDRSGSDAEEKPAYSVSPFRTRYICSISTMRARW